MSMIVYDSTDIIILDIHQYLMKRHNTKCLNSLKKKFTGLFSVCTKGSFH